MRARERKTRYIAINTVRHSTIASVLSLSDHRHRSFERRAVLLPFVRILRVRVYPVLVDSNRQSVCLAVADEALRLSLVGSRRKSEGANLERLVDEFLLREQLLRFEDVKELLRHDRRSCSPLSFVT